MSNGESIQPGQGRRVFCFLRGINLGRRRVSNAELCSAFGRIGFPAARAYRAAGNIVLTGAEAPETVLVSRIDQGLEAELGYPVRAVVRDAEAVTEIAAGMPFTPAELAAYKGKVQVCLFDQALSRSDQQAVTARSSERDRLVPSEREIYWLPSGGVSESELDWNGLAPPDAVQTVRTLGTIEGLIAKFIVG